MYMPKPSHVTTKHQVPKINILYALIVVSNYLVESTKALIAEGTVFLNTIDIYKWARTNKN